MKRALALVGLALLAGCMGPAANPHYQLGRAYQLKGIWYYPNESYDLDDTGLAAMFGSGHPPLTANGEVFDQSVVMAGHATLQLPAIARLTNLENGRSVLVRINDRGTGNPGRLVEVTNRTAILLDMRDRSATRMRLLVLPVESRAAVDAIPGAPALALTAAPRGAVTASVLAPPPGVAALADRTTPPVVTAAAEVRPGRTR